MMGNRTYLLLDDTIELFEANNTLPLFWLVGIRLSDMREKYQEVTQECERITEQEIAAAERIFEENRIGEISLYLDTYLKTLEDRRAYIDKIYPYTAKLYERFIELIHKEKNQNSYEKIYIDFTELLNFYEDYRELYELLLSAAAAIQAGMPVTGQLVPETLVEDLIGFDTYANHTGVKIVTAENYATLLKELAVEDWLKPQQDKMKSDTFFKKLKQALQWHNRRK